MTFETVPLGTLLSEPSIEPIAAMAICNRDLAKEALWNETLTELKEKEFFSSDVGSGIERLYRAAKTGDWFFPLYSAAECADDPARGKVNLVWLPSSDEGADGRPFILLVPGGGFVNVWSLTEGWPVAQQFNRLGYHVFVLTYQLEGSRKLLEKDMQDFARALHFIKEHEEKFHLAGDKYITCGFSAGGYLVCLWNTGMGYRRFGLPKPQAVFPIYPLVSLNQRIRFERDEPDLAMRLFGCSYEEAAAMDYEIPEHAEGFPPCAIFVTAEDELVSPDHSRILAAALEKLGIPCRLEIGPTGGHGFADGTDTCMDGWTQRALEWVRSGNRDG